MGVYEVRNGIKTLIAEKNKTLIHDHTSDEEGGKIVHFEYGVTTHNDWETIIFNNGILDISFKDDIELPENFLIKIFNNNDELIPKSFSISEYHTLLIDFNGIDIQPEITEIHIIG